MNDNIEQGKLDVMGEYEVIGNPLEESDRIKLENVLDAITDK